MSASGIYKITNTATGKCYVGSAVNLPRREKEHFIALRKGKHHSKHLQRAYILHGAECFVFSIIETTDKASLLEREQYWIDKLHAYGKEGYNVLPKAGSSLGAKRSDATRRKISQSKQGKASWNAGLETGPQPPELVKKRIDPLRGVSRPDEVGQAISKTKKALGQKPTPEAIARSAEVRRKNAELRKAGLLPPLFNAERSKQVGMAISAAKQAAKAARLQQLLNK